MEIDDMLSVDLLRGSLNMFLEKNEKQEPSVSVFRSRLYFQDDNWDGMKSKLERQGFICERPQSAYYNPKKLEEIFSRDEGSLEKVYQAICKLAD